MADLGSATGNINVLGDHDWFKVNLNANTLYTLTSSDGYLFVMHDASGARLFNSDGSGGFAGGDFSTSGIAFMPTVSGTFYLDLSRPGGVGAYTLKLGEVADDYRSNVTTSGVIAVGGTLGGTLNAPGDHDWIKVSLAANTLYAITATGGDLIQLQMRDASGAILPSLDNVTAFSGGFSDTVGMGFMPVTGGDYYIDVSSFGSTSGYSLSVAASADDYRNNTSTTGALATGATVNGIINVTGDHDWFKVSLQANTLYAIDAPGSARTSLVVMDANGQIVGTPDAFGSHDFQSMSAAIGFMPKVAGNYFIDVGKIGETGAYSLRLATSPDDYPNNPTTTGTVAVGGTTTGILNIPGDHDWFRVNLMANTLYAITAPATAGGTLAIYDPNGQAVGAGDAVGGSSLGFMPAASGTYYIDFSSFGPPSASAATAYSISVAASADDYASNATTSGVATPNGSVAGVLNVAGDHDWIKVNLAANTLYAITATGLDSLSLTVRNAGGEDAGTLDSFGSGALGFMPAAAGQYFIDIASSGATGNYALNIAAVADDFRNNVTTLGATGGAAPATSGTSGNDTLGGTAGNDLIDGLAGTDTVVYSGNRSSYSLAKTGIGFSLMDNSGRDGTDTLQNVERIKFADQSIALDVGATQPAGQAQLLLGAVLGKDLLALKKPLLGTAIDLFDQGFTLAQLSGAIMRLDIWGLLANAGNASATNTQIANYLLTTVNKAAPDAGTLAAAVTALNTETGAAQGNFLWHLAESAANQTQVGLVGLATTGLEFGP